MTIAVAGAGIAGLTAALALAAHGFEVDVHEREDALAEAGAGLQISPNGVALLRRLGVEPLLDGAACCPEALVMRDGASGAELTRLTFGEAMRRRYGAPYVTLLRTDLQAALVAKLRDDPRITLSLRSDVHAVRGTEAGVTFTAGGQTRRADLLIAADGIHSATRALLHPEGKAKPLGRMAWRAVVATADAPAFARDNLVGVFMAAGAHLVHYPVAGGARVNVVVVDPGAADLPASDPFGTDARALIAAARGEWLRTPLLHHRVRRGWFQHRVALIGDAAHAMAPSAAQGAVQAMEDAWVLARSLRQHDDDPIAALVAYERSRRSRVAGVAADSLRNLHIYEMQGVLAAARNAALRALPERVLMRRVHRIYRWRPA